MITNEGLITFKGLNTDLSRDWWQTLRGTDYRSFEGLITDPSRDCLQTLWGTNYRPFEGLITYPSRDWLQTLQRSYRPFDGVITVPSRWLITDPSRAWLQTFRGIDYRPFEGVITNLSRDWLKTLRGIDYSLKKYSKKTSSFRFNIIILAYWNWFMRRETINFILNICILLHFPSVAARWNSFHFWK